MDRIRPAAPSGRAPPPRAVSTKRYLHELQQWQRNYETARLDRSQRWLPQALDDEVPKAWMTRALVHEEMQPKTSCLKPVAKSSPSSAPRPCEAGLGDKQATEAEVNRLLKELSELREIEAKDATAQREIAVAKRALREVERARYAAELAGVPQRLAEAEMEAVEAAEQQRATQQHFGAESDEKQRSVLSLQEHISADEAEITRLAAEQRARELQLEAEEAELEALQTRVDAQGALCRDAESGVATATEELRVQRLDQRWASLSTALLQCALAAMFTAAEAELLDSAGDAVTAADTWRARCAAENAANARQLQEVSALRTRAADLEVEVENMLAEFLSLAWQRVSRPTTPA